MIDTPKQMSDPWGSYYDFTTKQFMACDGESTIYFIEPKEFTVQIQLELQIYLQIDG